MAAGSRGRGAAMPRSRCSSLKMLSSDGGTGTPGGTEKHRPCAWPAPWYGSWPRITTLTWSNGVASSAAKICGRGGKMRAPAALRSRRNADSACMSVALQVVADARLPRRLEPDAIVVRRRRAPRAHASKLRCSGSRATRSWNSALVTSRRSSIGLSTRSLAPSRSRLLWLSRLASPVITSTGSRRLP